MEHVSTLCATSTVGIAATGFALGRVDRSSSRPGLFRRKTLPLHDHRASATSTPEPPSSSVPPRSSKPATIKETESFSTTHPQGANDNGAATQAEDPISRRGSSIAVRLRRRGQTLTSPPPRLSEDQRPVSHSRRPSSSWLRRLSIVSFQAEGRFSPSPLSPTFNDPTSPVTSRPSTSQRRTPNKLVKRPPSQHSNAHPPNSSASPSTSTFPQFRRPATSYQRSETHRHRATHSLNFEPSFGVSNSLAQSILHETPPEIATHDGDWQPYLKPCQDGLPEKLARRLSTAGRPKDHGLRTISPSVDAAPALLLGPSLSNKEATIDVDRDVSTPATPVTPATPASPPVLFRDPFKPVDAPGLRPETPFPPERKSREPSPSTDEAGPKQTAPRSSTENAEAFRESSLAYAKRRVTSNPLPEPSSRERSNLNWPRRHERRNITDPNIFRRPPTASQSEFPISLSSDIRGPRRAVLPPAFRDFKADMGSLRDTNQRPFTSDAVAFSTMQNGESAYSSPSRQRPKRHSIAASDPASTVIGSDDTRIFTSGDEDETDFLTDTAFDSIRTHFTTSSNPGFHGPRIESIFDKNPAPGLMSEGLVKLEDLIPRGSFTSRPLDKESVSDNDLTPIRLSDHARREAIGSRGSATRLSMLSDLSDDDEDSRSMLGALPSETNGRFTRSMMRPILPLEAYQDEPDFFSDSFPDFPDSRISSPQHEGRSLTKEALDACPKMNIFDWSEQPRSDREVSGSDFRPRTVHGKHGPENRGSRTSGRKAPSALHLRSQSVPSVTRDPSLASESRQTSGKFGTWGLGSKGVSEDWDSDFEFDDGDEGALNEEVKPDNNISQPAMMVPQAILERQASLRGQFGQVQELTLLVAELKRLRHQASVLDLVHGPSNELWKEAEGIVDLATLDDDDNNDSPPRSPSSLTFSFDDSEGESSNTNDPSKRISGESWRASLSDRSNPGRPNQGSSTKAKSVLDLIYQQRVSNDSTLTDSHVSRSQKLPFDTQSLRDLVVRAGVITRALKDVIRKAEGVATSPDQDMLDPPFSRIFRPSTNDNISKFETRCIG